MAPALIRSNLERQREAIKSALRKTTGGLKKSGYNAEAVDEAIGADEATLAPAAQAVPRINLGGGASGQARLRARNPKTGEVIEFDGQQWVPAQ
jgi:hypothetical protein